ncbi:MAG: LPS-assembly protein LptD [Beijerinckiaceae bacterium]
MGLAARHRTLALPFRPMRAGSVLALGLSALLLSSTVLTAPAFAQEKKKMLVEANQLVYDNDKNKVYANGNAQIYYDNKVLEADKVIYDRASKRVYAEGNVKMTDENGAVTYSTKLELTDNFRDGFIDSLRLESPTVVRGERLNVRFSSPRAERTDGQTTTFALGTYTACEPCKDNPEKPPFWQVRAAKIIHNAEEKTVYYDNATLELYGVPIAWIPYGWSPDNTVRRKSGFIAPRYIHNTALGTGVQLNYFWELAPNYDLTLSPTYLSRQGFLAQAEWRHRLMNGSYSVRASGIFQRDPQAFDAAPYGARDRDFRGAVETTGLFHINERWKWGWDGALLTDRWYLDNYKIRTSSISTLYYRDVISTLYLRGQGDRSFFDARGYYFMPTTSADWQKQQPIVAPVIDYNKRWNGPRPLGGEVALDMNVTSLTREQTQYGYLYRSGATNGGVPVNPLAPPSLLTGVNRAGTPFSIYEGCVQYAPVRYVNGRYVSGDCLVRGLAGQHNRISASLTWRRQFIDPVGGLWTPFAGLRLDGIWFSPNLSSGPNVFAKAMGVTDPQDNFFGRATPTIGLEYRFPLVANTSWGTHIIEPIAQIVARPNETRIGNLPNNDALSLPFDDTNIFEWNKFSGYDRVEGGVRANIGAQYTWHMNGGGYANFLVGQSYQMAGRNSFATWDLANTGAQSGLERRRSDIIARAIFAPSNNLSFFARARFNPNHFGVTRLEVGSNFTLDRLTGSVLYARYAAQPDIGYFFRREGIAATAALKVTNNWSFISSAVVDLDRHLQAKEALRQGVTFATKPSTSRFALSSMSLGLQYKDECTIFSIVYTASGFRDGYNGLTQPSRSILARLEFRTLGEIAFKQSLNALQDGL